ncbi:MAG: SH3 domain-containing protein, partial [Proteobacteria bacterium]|nr:SH3 domain-containing protein [Pseudomonadota bacterium]
QQEEVFKPEPESEEAVSQVAHQEVEPTPETVGPLTQIVSVKGSVVNIRSGPGTTNKVIAKVRRGDELEVMGETLSWYNVKLSSGVEGWIYKKLVR